MFYPPVRYEDHTEMLPILVSFWRAVGIEILLKPVEYNQWLKLVAAKSYPGMIDYSKGAGVLLDPTSAFNRHITCDGQFSNYCNKQIDDLVKSGQGILDPDKVAPIFPQPSALCPRRCGAGLSV
jgi:ABC-type transport system substrate-binding protein